jgi:hypothetical protein
LSPIRSTWFQLALICFAACKAYPAVQADRSPKVVIDLKQPVDKKSFPPGPFGASCHSSRHATLQMGNLNRATSMAALIGDPKAIVRVWRYGPAWKSPHAVRAYVAKLLQTQSGEIFDYEPWAEFVLPDIAATIQFSDKKEGALEVSGVHACFIDPAGSVVWVRVFPKK